jgi:hypothetical protein
MSSTYKTTTSSGWKDMGDPFRMCTTDGIFGCPQSAPFQCGYNEGNPVCVSHPSLCPNPGVPAGPGDGFSLVPLAHPPKSGFAGFCQNKFLPATQISTRECQMKMPDLQSIRDGVYGDGLPYLSLATPFPTPGGCHSKYTARVGINPQIYQKNIYDAHNEYY